MSNRPGPAVRPRIRALARSLRDPQNPAGDRKIVLVRKDRAGQGELVRVLEAELVDPRTLLVGPR